MPKVEAWMAKKAGKTNCTLENAAVRREWCVWFCQPPVPSPSSHARKKQERSLSRAARGVYPGGPVSHEEATPVTKRLVPGRPEPL